MSWSEIYGHTQQKQYFQRVIQNQTQSHAYLFSGPEGVGKGIFAFEIARILNCLNPSDNGSCGLCSNCQLINARTHPDVLFLAPREGKIIIEDVRDFIYRFGLQRTLGKYRVGIVQSAELFSKEEVQNCLLKTIEEPPKQSMIILLTSQLQAILPTLLSRCQKIHFQLLKAEDIAHFLKNSFNFPDQKALEIALQSNGRIGNAIDLMKGNQPLIEKAFFLWDWIGSGKEIFSLGPWFIENKDQVIQILSQLEWYLRDILMYCLKAEKSTQYLNYLGYIHRIERDSKRFPFKVIARLILTIEQLEKDIKNNLNLDVTAFHFVLLAREELQSASDCRD